MRRLLLALLSLALLLAALLLAYGWKGYRDALAEAPAQAARADALIAAGRGAEGLGDGRAEMLLAVQDPAFLTHTGVDLTTPGAGLTTVTQSLAKRLGFAQFRPGLGKIRQTGYAMGLEARLTKPQIFALWLDTLEMGEGPDSWMTGFWTASAAIYTKPPAALGDDEFLRLAAVLIAPSSYFLEGPDTALDERVRRIKRLLAGACTPKGNRDVWFEGCI